jgi:hypothetical protein
MGQGLGNQLFIYSYIMNLLIKNSNKNFEVRIYFNRKANSISQFQLSDLISQYPDKIKIFKNNKVCYFLRVLIAKLIRNQNLLNKFRIFHEYDLFTFEERLINVPCGSLVFGSYISSDYVSPIFNHIKVNIDKWLDNQHLPQITNEVLNGDTVFIHLRRNDAIKSQASVRGVLTEGYFDLALETISKFVGHKPQKLIVITDDVRQARMDLSNLNVTDWLGPEDLNVIQALKVFSRARFFIGSNSTLSWWGAKLNVIRLNSMVIMPNPFLAQESKADKALFIQGVRYLPSQ